MNKRVQIIESNTKAKCNDTITPAIMPKNSVSQNTSFCSFCKIDLTTGDAKGNYMGNVREMEQGFHDSCKSQIEEFKGEYRTTIFCKAVGNSLSISGFDLGMSPDDLDFALDAFLQNDGEAKNIRKISLSHLGLPSFPKSLCKFTELRELHIQNNQITSIPEEIGNLHNLNLLNLSHNQLESIPDTIGNLHCLKELVLASNRLTTLPKTMVLLENIHSIYLWGNEITEINGKFMEGMKNLRMLYLDSSVKLSNEFERHLGNCVVFQRIYFDGLDDIPVVPLPN